MDKVSVSALSISEVVSRLRGEMHSSVLLSMARREANQLICYEVCLSRSLIQAALPHSPPGALAWNEIKHEFLEEAEATRQRRAELAQLHALRQRQAEVADRELLLEQKKQGLVREMQEERQRLAMLDTIKREREQQEEALRARRRVKEEMALRELQARVKRPVCVHIYMCVCVCVCVHVCMCVCVCMCMPQALVAPLDSCVVARHESSSRHHSSQSTNM